MSASVRTKGFKELDRKLGYLAGASARKSASIGVSLMAGGLIVESASKRKCPVKTGNLRGSIATGLPEVKGDFGSISVGTDVDYAGYVERGTSRQRAQPYLHPGLTENKGKVVGEMGSAYRRMIREVAR